MTEKKANREECELQSIIACSCWTENPYVLSFTSLRVKQYYLTCAPCAAFCIKRKRKCSRAFYSKVRE